MTEKQLENFKKARELAKQLATRKNKNKPMLWKRNKKMLMLMLNSWKIEKQIIIDYWRAKRNAMHTQPCACALCEHGWICKQASKRNGEPPNRNLQRAGVWSSKATTTVFVSRRSKQQAASSKQQAATNLVYCWRALGHFNQFVIIHIPHPVIGIH